MQEIATDLFTFLWSLACVSMLIAGIWRFWKTRQEQGRCPECRRLKAREDFEQEMVGIFRRSSRSFDQTRDRGEWSIIPQAKYQISHRCKYCGHDWTTIETRKI